MNLASYQYRIFLFLTAVLFVVMAFLLVQSWRRRRENPTAFTIFLYLVCSMGFLTTNSLELLSGSRTLTAFWGKTIYLFVSFVPALWLNFTVRHVHLCNGVPKKILILLLIVPVTTIVFLFLPGTSKLIWKSTDFVMKEGLLALVVEHGIWFNIFNCHQYLVIFAVTFLMIRAYSQIRTVYVRKSVYILLGVFIPLLFNFIYVTRAIPGLVKDFSPIGFALSAVLFYVGVFRYDILSIVPVARALLVEHMSDGVLVLDGSGLIVDANSSAMRYLDLTERQIGVHFAGNPFTSGHLHHIPGRKEAGAIGVPSATDSRYYRFEYTPIKSRSEVWGQLVVIKDVTDTEESLKKAKDMAYTDPLTGIHNRRYFEIISKSILDASAEQGIFVTLAMMDLDDFKSVNDRFGHEAGDRVLKAFARVVEKEVRTGDVFARIGGEEFALLMKGVKASDAVGICSRINCSIRDQRFPAGKNEEVYGITVSIGCADNSSRTSVLNALMQNADAALYQAKRLSKDRTCVWCIEEFEDIEPS